MRRRALIRVPLRCLIALSLVPFLAGGVAYADEPPVVSISATPTSGTAPLTVEFTSTAYDLEGEIIWYYWSFDDGGYSQGAYLPTASHTYTTADTFQARLGVMDEAYQVSWASVWITVGSGGGDGPPTVSIAASPTSGTAPLTVNFTSEAFDGEGPLIWYYWAFGDGNVSQGPYLPTASHTYTSSGSFEAWLGVMDQALQVSWASATITVTPGGGGGTNLKVLSWNVQFISGTDGLYNPTRTASWVAWIDADLVALCELEDYEVPNLVNLITQISGRTWYTHFVRKGPGIAEGNLILSKYPFVGTGGYFLSYDRSVAHAAVNVGGRVVNFFATHLDHTSSTFRAIEIAELTAWAAGFAEPRIVAGDFNAGPDTWEIGGMTATYVDTWITAMGLSTATAYPDNPIGMHTRTRRGRIDHIYYSATATQLTLLSTQIPDSRDLGNPNVVIVLGNPDDWGVRPSDHNHMIATFEVR